MLDAVCKVLNSSPDLDIKNCRVQPYDNVSNMSGVYSCLQTLIKELNSQAQFMPCSAHSSNLVGTYVTECCDVGCNFFIFLQDLYNFFSYSTIRWEILQNPVSVTDEPELQDQRSTLKNLRSTQ